MKQCTQGRWGFPFCLWVLCPVIDSPYKLGVLFLRPGEIEISWLALLWGVFSLKFVSTASFRVLISYFPSGVLWHNFLKWCNWIKFLFFFKRNQMFLFLWVCCHSCMPASLLCHMQSARSSGCDQGLTPSDSCMNRIRITCVMIQRVNLHNLDSHVTLSEAVVP